MSTSSHFSNETESEVQMRNAWGWMHDEAAYIGEPVPPNRIKWWKRPRVFYPTLCLIIAAMVALTATAIVMGMGGLMSGWRPNRSGGDGGTPSDVAANDGNVEGTEGLTTLEPSPLPTIAPTASPIAAPTSAPTLQPTRGQRTEPFSFYVMGDIPYAKWEERVLISQITNLTASRHPGAMFVVHCGDMMKAQRTGCEPGFYQNVKNILSQGPLPTFVCAGDNDYLDCPNPELAWEHYLDTFSDFDEEWSYRLPAGVPVLGVHRWLLPENVPLEENVTRWTTRPEMFAFSEDGILFLSMTLMHVSDELPPDALFQERLADSKTWVTQQVTEAATEHRQRGERLRGVVMFGHARIAGYLRPFFMELKQVFYDALVLVPVLYIHGDGHKFIINDNFGTNIGWPQFVDVQVDQGAKADPLLIEVALSPGGLIQQSLISNNPNQYIVGNGLFRIDRQNGLYPSIDDEDVGV